MNKSERKLLSAIGTFLGRKTQLLCTYVARQTREGQLILAQTEKDASDIKKGLKELVITGDQTELKTVNDIEKLVRDATEESTNLIVQQEQINLYKTVNHANN